MRSLAGVSVGEGSVRAGVSAALLRLNVNMGR